MTNEITEGDTVSFEVNGKIVSDKVRCFDTVHHLLEPYARNNSEPVAILTNYSYIPLKDIIQEVSWVIQSNPTRPDAYSKTHLTKQGSKACLCGQLKPNNSKEKPLTRTVKETYDRELRLRADKGTDQEGVYCLFCLRKALKGGK
jgi:hypothetical protein